MGFVNRWWIALALVALFCVPIWAKRAEGPALLADSDTHVLLATIRERQDPWSWFRGDWPLENHFYRPISTLVFEMDNALYGSDPAGYGRTNAILAMLNVLLLFWFLRELTDRPAIAASGAILFALWTNDGSYGLAQAAYWLRWPILAALVVATVRERSRRPDLPPWALYSVPILAYLAWAFLPTELRGVEPLWFRSVGWLPGRTATTMTVFALISLAAYARYERLRHAARPRDDEAGVGPFSFTGRSPTERPATRSTMTNQPIRHPWVWAILSLAGVALALGAYEQAVMVPACLVAVAVIGRLRGQQPAWGWQVGFWGVLVGYLILRVQLVSSEVSDYQSQQLRSTPGNAWVAMLDYVFPAGRDLYLLLNSLDLGLWQLVLSGAVGATLFALAANLAAYRTLWPRWALPIGLLALSLLAYLPMAFLKMFEHYHYWPMALRAGFVVLLVSAVVQAVLSAVSPRAIPAPPRPRPAPGSLPRL